MSTAVRIAFERRIEVLPLARLLPLKSVPDDLKQTAKYKQIATSVSEVGIIEPLVVARPVEGDDKGQYLLLDGHLRHAVLTDAGEVTLRVSPVAGLPALLERRLRPEQMERALRGEVRRLFLEVCGGEARHREQRAPATVGPRDPGTSRFGGGAGDCLAGWKSGRCGGSEKSRAGSDGIVFKIRTASQGSSRRRARGA